MYLEEDWLSERFLATEQIARMLDATGMGGLIERQVALDRLADQLALDSDRLRDASYAVLDRLLDALSDILFPDRQDLPPKQSSVFEDVDSGRLDRVVERTVGDLTADDVILAMIQFGWGGKRVAGSSEARDLPQDLRRCLGGLLKDRLIRMLGKWYKSQGWTEETKRGARNRRLRPA
jgi:hypothetical protein